MKVDFAGLSEELKMLVAQTRKQVAGIDVRGVVEQWKKTGVAVEAVRRLADFLERNPNALLTGRKRAP